MLEKILKNKKILILLIFILLAVAGLIIGMFLSKGSKESGKSHVNNEEEQNQETVKEKDEDENESILEDLEEVDESTEDKTKVPNSWNSTGDNQPSDNNQNDNNDGKETDESEEDIIGDDKIWGEVF